MSDFDDLKSAAVLPLIEFVSIVLNDLRLLSIGGNWRRTNDLMIFVEEDTSFVYPHDELRGRVGTSILDAHSFNIKETRMKKDLWYDTWSDVGREDAPVTLSDAESDVVAGGGRRKPPSTGRPCYRACPPWVICAAVCVPEDKAWKPKPGDPIWPRRPW